MGLVWDAANSEARGRRPGTESHFGDFWEPGGIRLVPLFLKENSSVMGVSGRRELVQGGVSSLERIGLGKDGTHFGEELMK